MKPTFLLGPAGSGKTHRCLVEIRDVLKGAPDGLPMLFIACRRIAAGAQQIFNQINHNPVELEWSSERYSLRINPSDRRFAMLPGGEQTKLALAMTLAMIKECGSIQFSIFDEPTYGVDADSRKKLAEAIVKVQDSNPFRSASPRLPRRRFRRPRQNTILLKKTAAESSTASHG